MNYVCYINFLSFAKILDIMSKFSKSCEYAMRATLYLATNSSDTSKIGVEQLSTVLDIPKHFLGKILQQLTKNRLISSAKGRNGGFFLSEENLNQSLTKIIESFDGPGVFTDCVLGLKECSSINPCPYHHTIQKYRSDFYDLLNNESIRDAAKRINTHNFNL